jgi:TolB protein
MAVRLIFPSPSISASNNTPIVKSLPLRLTSIAVLTLVSLPLLHAQVRVPVTTVPSVGISMSGGAAGMATQVLSNDLNRTGSLLPASAGSGGYQATGQANSDGVSGSLVDKHSGQTLFSQSFSGNARTATHEFADAITKAITGRPGFASSKIAFVSGSGMSKELWFGDIDGYNTRALTHDSVDSASPSLSRDGQRLAYTSYKSGYPDVYVIDLGSGSRNRIAFFPGINSGPSFSPDGSRVALTLSKDGNPEIYTIPSSGGTPDRITRTRGSETSPSWSPDGSQLVFCSDDRGSPQLYISSAQGGGDWDHLMTGDSYCTKPDWSSDGKLIAFTARVSGQFQIGVFNMGTRTAQLITTSGGEDPAWTRDSRHLVYANNGRLFLLDTSTRLSQPIPVSAGSSSEPTVSR